MSIRMAPLFDTSPEAINIAPSPSIEVKKNPSLPDKGPGDIAFKVDTKGRAVPKGPQGVYNPYPRGSRQARAFMNALMGAGHLTLTR